MSVKQMLPNLKCDGSNSCPEHAHGSVPVQQERRSNDVGGHEGMMDVFGFLIKPLGRYVHYHTGNQFRVLLPAQGGMTVAVKPTAKLQQPVTFEWG